MQTILDEILAVQTNNLDRTPRHSSCGCAACSGSDTHWRVRRRQRLLPFISTSKAVRQNACNCSHCRNKATAQTDGEMAYHNVGGRQVRHGWPDNNLAVEEEMEDYTSFNLFYGIKDYSKQATPGSCASMRKESSCLGSNRSLAQVDAVVLHQTAGGQNVDPRNYLWVGAHFVILPNGHIMQLYPETRIVYHANSLNTRSVGIEFAGTFANDQGKCWWPSNQYVNRGYTNKGLTCGEPTAAQIEAGRNLLTALTDKIPSIRYVFAHRQASASRENDPGPKIWLQVGEWAKKSLGLSDGGNFKVSDGRTIPNTWQQGTITP